LNIQTKKKQPLSSDLYTNVETIKTILSNSPDLVIRFFTTRGNENVALIYLSSLINKPAVQDLILRPLMYEIDKTDHLTDINAHIPIGKLDKMESWEEVKDGILQGEAILFIENKNHAFGFCNQGWPQRAVVEPQLESSLKGSHQGFVETIEKNLALIRRYVTDENLVVKEYTIGKRAKVKVFMLYIEDIVNNDFLQQLDNRLHRIKADTVLDLGQLDELISEQTFTIFPEYLLTERPDNAASSLLHGRVILLMDHSPNALVAPMTLTAFFQSQDDFNSRWITASMLRLLRFVSFFIAITLPSIYIAIVSYHYEVIPLDLLLTIGKSRFKVPFPPILEAILMEIAIEMLREAGLRLPQTIGQTVGVVGGIVIGEAAVQAGIVSNIMVIVVAVTAIASFIIPNVDMSTAVRLIRFPMMILASLFGIVGVSVGIMLLFAHLISLNSLGVPYTSPLAPIRWLDWQDTFIRSPLRFMKNRPKTLKPKQAKRQGENQE
jgi:spore germination protein